MARRSTWGRLCCIPRFSGRLLHLSQSPGSQSPGTQIVGEAVATLLLLTDNAWRARIPGVRRPAPLACPAVLDACTADALPPASPPPPPAPAADDPSGRWREAQQWLEGNPRAARLAAVGLLGAELAALAAALALQSIYQAALDAWLDDREEATARARQVLNHAVRETYAGMHRCCCRAAAVAWVGRLEQAAAQAARCRWQRPQRPPLCPVPCRRQRQQQQRAVAQVPAQPQRAGGVTAGGAGHGGADGLGGAVMRHAQRGSRRLLARRWAAAAAAAASPCSPIACSPHCVST